MKQFKWLMWIALLTIASSSMAGRAVKRDPPGTDRPSGDFQRTVLPQADAELCVNQCAADLRCSAYSYVKPNVQGKDPLCYLKGAPAPRPVKNACCTSGTMHTCLTSHYPRLRGFSQRRPPISSSVRRLPCCATGTGGNGTRTPTRATARSRST